MNVSLSDHNRIKKVEIDNRKSWRNPNTGDLGKKTHFLNNMWIKGKSQAQ